MGTLKYAILGLLRKKSMTGYELSKEFETSLFEFWNAKHSQIYPELKSLTKADLIHFEVRITGNIMEKKVYTITNKGIEEFQKWAENDIESIAVPKDEFRLQLYFSDCISSKRRIELLQNQLLLHKERLDYLIEKVESFDNIKNLDEVEFCDYMVMQSGVMREQCICNWIKSCIRLCKKRIDK